MKGRRRDTDEEMLRGLINQPGWDLLVEKAKVILSNADQRLHTSDKGGFDESKGFYQGVKIFHDLIVNNPREIANLQGVIKVKRS
jgi:hypothetical protein